MSIFDLLKRKEGASHTGELQNRRTSSGLRFQILDVFSITGRGIVVVGNFEQGTIHVGDEIILSRVDGRERVVVIGGIEKFKQGMIESASQGENVGVFLKDITKDDVAPGDILTR
ncbi:MAG: hypothetical protein J1E64_12360 [Acetatifactor sp.]|nr:hypothetical protein [Acetatifactor sp.]